MAFHWCCLFIFFCRYMGAQGIHCYVYAYLCSILVGSYCYSAIVCNTVPTTVEPLHGCSFPFLHPFAVVCISGICCSSRLNVEPGTLTKKQVTQVFNWTKETVPLQSANFISPHWCGSQYKVYCYCCVVTCLAGCRDWLFHRPVLPANQLVESCTRTENNANCVEAN